MKKNVSKTYTSYTDDFVTSNNQNYELKDNYKWLNNNIFYKIISSLLYFFSYLVALIYSKLILRVTFKNKEVLRKYKGYYLFGNHTQMIGDALNPLLLTFPKKNYIVASTANLGIPILGKILTFVGALPIPRKIHEKEALFTAMHTLVKTHSITIYPEAHLWPYYTSIRPLPISSFKFPVKDNVPSFSMTTTYQKRKLGKRPKITIYIDGPFYPDNLPTRKEQAISLRDKVYNQMTLRSKNSTYSYIKYEKRIDDDKDNNL